MRKKLIIAFSIIFLLGFTACDYAGYDFVDTNYHFDRAIIYLPDGKVVSGEIDSWADSEGEQLTITFTNGNRYLINSVNCVLIEDLK